MCLSKNEKKKKNLRAVVAKVPLTTVSHLVVHILCDIGKTVTNSILLLENSDDIASSNTFKQFVKNDVDFFCSETLLIPINAGKPVTTTSGVGVGVNWTIRSAIM